MHLFRWAAELSKVMQSGSNALQLDRSAAEARVTWPSDVITPITINFVSACHVPCTLWPWAAHYNAAPSFHLLECYRSSDMVRYAYFIPTRDRLHMPVISIMVTSHAHGMKQGYSSMLSLSLSLLLSLSASEVTTIWCYRNSIIIIFIYLLCICTQCTIITAHIETKIKCT